MSRVIVDASVLIAALMSDGSTRHALLHPRGIEFVVPAFIFDEIERRIERIVARASVSREVVRALLEDLRARIEVVPRGGYSEFLAAARAAAGRAGAQGDEDYLALSMALQAPIWTFDKDFARIPGIPLMGSRDIQDLGTDV